MTDSNTADSGANEALASSTAELRARLRERLGEALSASILVEAPEELDYYGQDRCRGGWPVAPLAIAFPRTVDEVQACVRACAQLELAIVPSGGRTGLAGGATATAGELVLSLERLNRRCEVDAEARRVHCDGGVTVQRVHEAAAQAGLSYPVDWAASGSAHVAGSIATNAGGIRVLRYGMTREWVRGLSIVLASGELLELGCDVIKDNTGYDLRQLFIGSEGTLGIIVGATLALTRPPADRVVALVALPNDAALLALLRRLGDSSLRLSAFECFDEGCVGHVLSHRGDSASGGPFSGPDAALGPQQVVLEVEVDAPGADAREAVYDDLALLLADAQEADEIFDAVLSANAAQAQALWAWREDISESLHPHTPHKADVCLPVHRLVDFMAAWREAVAREIPEIEARCFGHVGDGNLHLNLLRPEGWSLERFLDRCHAFDPIMYGLVQTYGGSVSAEHGIGLLKRGAIGFRRSPAELAAMRALKAALDPQGRLNPGKVFPPTAPN